MDTQLNFGSGSGNKKQFSYALYIPLKLGASPSREKMNDKTIATKKEISNLYSCGYRKLHRRNVNFEEIDTELSRKNFDGF